MGLSCGVTSIFLGGMPWEKPISSMSEQEKEAVGHYLGCEEDCARGIAEIIGINKSCQDIILILAEHPSATSFNFYRQLSPNVQTLAKIYTIEHILGKVKKVSGQCVYDGFGCPKISCRRIARTWYDEREVDYEFGSAADIKKLRSLIDIFKYEGWPLDKLLAIQEGLIKGIIHEYERHK